MRSESKSDHPGLNDRVIDIFKCPQGAGMMGPHGTVILCPSIWAKACDSDSGLGIFQNDNNVGGSLIVDHTRSLGGNCNRVSSVSRFRNDEFHAGAC